MRSAAPRGQSQLKVGDSFLVLGVGAKELAVLAVVDDSEARHVLPYPTLPYQQPSHIVFGLPLCLHTANALAVCAAVEESDSGDAGAADAVEQTAERRGSDGMAVELMREGRELFVQV